MDVAEQSNFFIVRHPWEQARFSIFLDLISKVVPQSNDLKTIVDVGCGDCYFAAELLKVRNDIRIIGIDTAFTEEELNKKVAEINNSRFLLFSNRRLAHEFLSKDKVHLILLLDVLEHIADDKSFLKDIADSFNVDADSRILISVPAFQSLFSAHDNFLKHFQRYNLPSLQKLIEESDMVTVKSGYFFLSLLPIRFFQKFMQQRGYSKQQTGIGAWRGSRFLSSLFKNYLLFDFKLSKLMDKVGIKLPGLSIYYICKKPAS